MATRKAMNCATALRFGTRFGVFVLLFLGAFAPVAKGQGTDAPTVSEPAAREAAAQAGTTSRRSAQRQPAATAEELQAQAGRIRSLLGDSLLSRVDAESLFDIPVHDTALVQVEVERLRSVLGRRTLQGAHETTATLGTRLDGEEPAVEGEPDAEPAAAVSEQQPVLDSALYRARVALDRARLSFYELPAARRDSLLQRHAQRLAMDAEAWAQAEISEVEERARTVASERHEALKAAESARSEASRLVAEELARLLGVAGAQADFEARLVRRGQIYQQRSDSTLALHRRSRAVLGEQAEPASLLYRELRAFLRSSRDRFAEALAALRESSEVPDAKAATLGEMSLEVDRTALEEAEREVRSTAARLRQAESDLRRARASRLYDEIDLLNDDRLALLSRLPEGERDAITGFSPEGLDQAGAELRHLTLILRYHLEATRQWLEGLLGSSDGRSRSIFTGSLLLLKWLLASGVFLWWRRRGGDILTRARDRAQEKDRRDGRMQPSGSYRFLDLVRACQSPLEWLLYIWALVWLLPPFAQAHLEVRLTWTVFAWILGGTLAIIVIDRLAGQRESAPVFRSASQVSDLRLRSIRLAVRTAVVFGLILSLSSQTVGRGTLFSWVWFICWFAALFVILVLVKWWRQVIFERVNAIRKKNGFERWVASNPDGWKSFPSAVSGGIYLFAVGAFRVGRQWIGGFDVTRRALAYLFRRGLDRMAEEKAEVKLTELDSELFAALGPEAADQAGLVHRADEQVQAVIERLQRVGGGVFAVVGERGSGKTTVLRHVSSTHDEVVMVDCPVTGLEGLRAELAKAIGAQPESTLDACAAELNARGHDVGLLIDNAHRLIQPVMGGLAPFDTLVDVARRHSTECSWFFAADSVIWRFFERARGAKPLFDEVVRLKPWREEEIVSLLTGRSRSLGLEPSFEHMREKLATDADEIDHQEALDRAASGYMRMLWDYSGGSPGVALHMWRRSLGVDGEGQVCVRLFPTPDARELEQLPDSAIFVLRAVIQLAPALPADITRATMLNSAQVEDAIRYGLAHGYIERLGPRLRVTWEWFRPITRYLQRRHLLAQPRA